MTIGDVHGEVLDGGSGEQLEFEFSEEEGMDDLLRADDLKAAFVHLLYLAQAATDAGLSVDFHAYDCEEGGVHTVKGYINVERRVLAFTNDTDRAGE